MGGCHRWDGNSLQGGVCIAGRGVTTGRSVTAGRRGVTAGRVSPLGQKSTSGEGRPAGEVPAQGGLAFGVLRGGPQYAQVQSTQTTARPPSTAQSSCWSPTAPSAGLRRGWVDTVSAPFPAGVLSGLTKRWERGLRCLDSITGEWLPHPLLVSKAQVRRQEEAGDGLRGPPACFLQLVAGHESPAQGRCGDDQGRTMLTGGEGRAHRGRYLQTPFPQPYSARK